MPILAFRRILADFAKTVHVELPHKRRKVIVLKVLGQHHAGKLGWIWNDNAVASRTPLHEFPALGVIQNVGQLGQKSRKTFSMIPHSSVL
jgi:hypothetical protein